MNKEYVTALNTNNFASQAKMYRHTFLFGISCANEIISWAKHIVESHIHHEDLTSLAAQHNPTNQQVMDILGRFSIPPGDDSWWRLTKKAVFRALVDHKIQGEKAVSYFYDLAIDADIPPYDCEALYQFELEYACLNEGFASQAEVDSKVKDFFSESRIVAF